MALWLGSGIHEALDKYYASNPRNEAILEQAFRAWANDQIKEIETNLIGDVYADQVRLDIEKNFDLGIAMLENYAKFAPENDDFDVLQTEFEFDIPLGIETKLYDAEDAVLGTVPVYYRGRIDGIIRKHDTGNLYLLEHKTAKQFNEQRLILDQQATSYMWAGEQVYGERISGVYYNILRKQADGPRVKNPLVYRLEVERSRASIENFPLQMQMIAHDMALAAEYGLYYHTPADDCNWCAFFTLCSMIQDEADPQDYIDMYFKKSEFYEEEDIYDTP